MWTVLNGRLRAGIGRADSFYGRLRSITARIQTNHTLAQVLLQDHVRRSPAGYWNAVFREGLRTSRSSVTQLGMAYYIHGNLYSKESIIMDDAESTLPHTWCTKKNTPYTYENKTFIFGVLPVQKARVSNNGWCWLHNRVRQHLEPIYPYPPIPIVYR